MTMLLQRKAEPWTYTRLNEAEETWLPNVMRDSTLALEFGKLRTLFGQLVKYEYVR